MRDTRIDVFRALALLTIFINHVPGTIYEHLTHKNFGFSDSAEAFVLISGIAVGLAYGLKFKPGNRLLMTLKAWRRAGVLYVAHIMTTVATLAIFSAAALYFKQPVLLRLINIDIFIDDTPEALVGIATLGHQIGYNNILSMYAVVLLMMPFFLLLGSVSLRLMVAVSGTLWLARRHLSRRARQLPHRGLLVPQSAVLAVPVRDRNRGDAAREARRHDPVQPLARRRGGGLPVWPRCSGCASRSGASRPRSACPRSSPASTRASCRSRACCISCRSPI